MASEAYNFGDGATNKVCDLNCKVSNHIFDGAGEHVRYHSDSESLGSRKSSKTRYINPAIYVDTVEATHSVTSLHADSYIGEITPHPHSTYRSNSTPFLSGRESNSSHSSSVKRKSCRLLGHDKNLALDMYDAEEETPRYQEECHDTFRLSVASVSTTATAKEQREQEEKKKQEAFNRWLARKEQEKREKARLEKQKRQQMPVKSPEEREESFRRWLECKRKQKERRRAEEIMKKYSQNEHFEQERNKREKEKEEKLAMWIKKKEEEMKLMKTREERKAARAAIEEERRRAQGERAFRDWLRTSKNKPLPVPLNQGELSMRGSISEMYINPIPWQ